MTDDGGDRDVPKSQNGALYFPYLRLQRPVTGESDHHARRPASSPGSSPRDDTNRGVWKAPAGLSDSLNAPPASVPPA